MPATTKELTIGKTTYQLGRFSARNGSWIAGQFASIVLGKLEGSKRELDEKKLGLLLAVSLRAFSPETFHEIQAQCLAVCKRYGKVGEDTIPMPVVRADSGQWNDVDEPSLPEVMVLTVACLSFNLFPFFESGALEMLRMAFPLMAELTSGPEA